MPKIILHSLQGISLFDGLTKAERAVIEKNCRWKRYGPQEHIIDRQSDSHEVYFIIAGKVRVVNYSVAGREITLDDLSDGNHFGELSALDNQPRSAGVIALQESLIASMPQETFIKMVETHPALALRVMRHLATIVRAATERIMDLSTLGANNRVHAELLREARANVTGNNSAEISPIPVHADMASRVSTTRETVARVLNDLARKKIVKRTRESLVVLDLEALQAMVDEVRGV